MRIYIEVIKMKISVSTLGLYPATMENILDFVTEQKLDYLEVIKEYPYDEVGADVFESYDLGLKVYMHQCLMLILPLMLRK